MNTNDETRVAKPNQSANNVKNAQRKPNDRMAAKVAGAVGAGLVGSAAIGAAAAVVGDYIGQNDQDNVVETPVENVAPHTAVHEQPEAQPVAQPAPKPTPKPEPDPEAEVHFVGINFVDIDDDGTPEIAGAMTIDGQDVVVIDLDVDGVFDVAILDADHNGIYDENDIIDISEAKIGVVDFAAQVVNENPEGAHEFLATIDAMNTEDAQGSDVITVAQETQDSEATDDGLIEVVAPASPDGEFVAVVDAGEPVDAGFVEVAQVEDDGAAIYAENVQEEVGMDTGLESDLLMADNDDFGGGIDDMGGSDLIDC